MTSFDAFGETGRFECKRLDPGARLRCRAENRTTNFFSLFFERSDPEISALRTRTSCGMP